MLDIAPTEVRLVPQTGDDYLESLRDGREVWIYGERVPDVTTHPAFRNSARSIARLYDAMHDGPRSARLLSPTDLPDGGRTHPFFKVARSTQDLRDAVDGIRAWQELVFGWMGRTPDYKAAMLTGLGSDPEFHGEYAANARAWYARAQREVTHMAHAIVNPPVDRGRPVEETRDVFVHVEKETDRGLVISGAKVVATGAPLTQNVFVSHFLVPVQDKSFALTFIAPGAGPGIKYFARASYEQTAATMSSPFDYPLSSRFDENDAILIYDNALIPWENVLIYDPDRAQRFARAGWQQRAQLQSAVRLEVKLDFIAGLVHKALLTTGSIEFRGVQAGLGEIIAYRNLIAGIRAGMIEGATPGPGGSVEPNSRYARSYSAVAPGIYRRVREIVETVVASGLIYLNSHAVDFETPEMRPYLDQFMRGSDGIPAIDRSRTMKLLWDAIGSEFGARHELYELNYFGQPEAHHLASLAVAKADGTMAGMESLVEECMSDYDTKGWTAGDLASHDDVSVITRAG